MNKANKISYMRTNYEKRRKIKIYNVGDNEVVKCKGKKVDLRKLKIGKRGTKGVKVRK